MFHFGGIARTRTESAQLAAIKRSQAVIEFALDGTVITANENFLEVLGYELSEIVGKHHSMFLEPEARESADYRAFWSALNRGEFKNGEFKRLAKGGREVWIQASYNPVLDGSGRTISIIKFAADTTAAKFKALGDSGRIAAIDRAQAVIEFKLDGTIVTANKNFLDTVGYSLAEIEGQHHRMFVDPAERDSAAYRKFWDDLSRGEYQAAVFKRIGKGGKKVWIQASYNPIFDDKGRVIAVVKFATDITAANMKAADTNGQIDAILKSQAVIEFALDGTILSANKNFCDTLGYPLSEIKNKHHSMFVDPHERTAPEYAEFWKDLASGVFKAGEYKRIAKGGLVVWIQASYNPIFDLDGKPVKVVKFASDVTVQAVGRAKAENARGFIDSVAAGSEEMSASIREISETMAKSRLSAETAVDQVRSADEQAKRLTDATSAMGGIVELIGNITGQINLLALNATIESARAGEAGRGFAVVASEVKNLASQAKSATDKINSEIEALNSISGDVVTALTAIRAAITEVEEYVNSTGAAVEEQTTVTADMSANMQRASAELAV